MFFLLEIATAKAEPITRTGQGYNTNKYLTHAHTRTYARMRARTHKYLIPSTLDRRGMVWGRPLCGYNKTIIRWGFFWYHSYCTWWLISCSAYADIMSLHAITMISETTSSDNCILIVCIQMFDGILLGWNKCSIEWY